MQESRRVIHESMKTLETGNRVIQSTAEQFGKQQNETPLEALRKFKLQRE